MVRGIASMVYGKGVVAVIQLITVPVLALHWGVHLFGQWLMLSTIPSFLAASDLGFGTAAGIRIIGEVARGEEDEALHTFQSALLVIFACTFAIAIFGLALLQVVPDRWIALDDGLDGAAARQVLGLLILYGFVALQGGLFGGVLRAHHAFARQTMTDATIQLVEGGVVIGAALLDRGPVVAAASLLAVRSAGVLAQVGMAKGHAHWLQLGFGHASRERAGALLRPALGAMMLPMATAGYLQGTALAVGAAAGAAAVPVYTSLRTLSRLVLQILMAINLPFLPEFAAEFARGNRDWVLRAAGAIGSFNALIGVAGAVALALSGPWLIHWWTAGTITPPPAMIWLTAGAIAASSTWNPLSNLLLAVNRHARFTVWYAAASAAAVVLTYVLVRQFGLTGAGLANLCLDAAVLTFAWYFVRREIGAVRFGWQALGMFTPRLMARLSRR